MSKIVISYRRADSEAMAGRIRDRLANEFGEDSVFMDIDSIPIGVNFRDYIAEALKDTDILLVIIGQRWLGDQGGRARVWDLPPRRPPARPRPRPARAGPLPMIFARRRPAWPGSPRRRKQQALSNGWRCLRLSVLPLWRLPQSGGSS
jgi:hypothetical protein